MSRLFLILFALAVLGEGIHVVLCYLRALKGKSPFRCSRILHWCAVLVIFVLWFAWNRFRTLG